MSGRSQTLTFKRAIDAPLSEVYRMFTHSTALREWLCDAAQADPRKGGRMYLWWNSGYYVAGEYTSLAPNKKVVFTWRGSSDPDATHVQVSLNQRKDGTVVTLSHLGVGSGKAWAATVAGFNHEWQKNLENLKSVMETGHDLRFTLRPMLGINVGQFDAEIAARMGVPVKDGILLDGVVETMGAYAAGLRKGDVVVNLGGKKLTGWPSLTNALQGHRAGDQVKVVYYRGHDKNTVTMELSKRPLPDMPSTAEGLAGALRKRYADCDAQLAACFDGVGEEEASHEPGPDEWSAKDVLCHLIAGERDTHSWIVNLIGGEEAWWDNWAGNLGYRHAGILSAFASAPELLEELRRNECETVGIVAAMPPQFVARKSSLWRVAYSLLQAPDHTQEHLDQIRAAIASAGN